VVFCVGMVKAMANIWLEDRSYLYRSGDFFIVRDKYPVSEGHLLIIPKDNRASIYTDKEWVDIFSLIRMGISFLKKEYSPNGFNIGSNIGECAGQSVTVFHIHIIPRYDGDVINPVGGIRNVIPSKADYLDKVHIDQIESEDRKK
jgi:diadenosine tetraphosphate (Ap4A) HIT family hydrolase